MILRFGVPKRQVSLVLKVENFGLGLFCRGAFFWENFILP